MDSVYLYQKLETKGKNEMNFSKIENSKTKTISRTENRSCWPAIAEAKHFGFFVRRFLWR